MSLTAVNVLRGFIGINSVLDFALGLIPSAGKGLKDAFPGLSEDGIAAFAAGLSTHGFIRAFAALNFGSLELRRAAQLSYLGEVISAVVLKDKLSSQGRNNLIIGPLVLILAIEWVNRNSN